MGQRGLKIVAKLLKDVERDAESRASCDDKTATTGKSGTMELSVLINKLIESI